jgi:hypothetical protein
MGYWVCAKCRRGLHSGCEKGRCWCESLRHRMVKDYVSRETHRDRLVSIVREGTGLSRSQTLRLFFDHLRGVIKP